MSFVYAERLIEWAIRIGVDDLQKNPGLTASLFETDKLTNLGYDLTPDGNTQKVYEPLVTDYFQKRILEIPKKPSEIGLNDIFSNPFPEMPKIYEYLQTLNMKIIHGYPREEKDLPCISITLGSENEQQYLGVVKGRSFNPDTKEQFLLVGSDWKTQYNISIYTTNYDETVLWHYFIKYALLTYRPHIEAYGLREQSITFLDVEPGPEYLSAGLFVYQRSAILSAAKDETVPVVEAAYQGLEFGLSQDIPTADGDIIPESVFFWEVP